MKSSLNKIFSGLNHHELIFDIVLFLYVILFINTVGGNIHFSYSSWFFVFGGGLATFTILWFYGILIRNLEAQTNNKIILAIIIIAGLWIAASLVFTLIDHVRWLYNLENDNRIVVVGNAFLIIYGVVTGIYMALTEITCNKGESAIIDRLQFFRVYGLGLLFFPTIALTTYLSIHVNEKAGNLVSLAVVGVGILLFLFMNKTEDRLEEKSKKQKLMESRQLRFFKAYILPFLLISSLCLLEEIYVWGAIHHEQITGQNLDSGSLLIHLLITGIIPLRIIFAIHPPVCRKNLIIGFISIGYFIYSVVALVGKLNAW